ncbi:MAG: hypothetical protein AB7F99_18030 [Vicinamibacterales bacterium]
MSRRLLAVLIPVAAGLAIFFALRTPASEMVEATGTVASGIEHVIQSPADARVVAVAADVGDHVGIGDEILSADVGDAQLQAGRIERDLAITHGQHLQAQMALQDRLTSIDVQIDQKAVELRTLNARYSNARRAMEDASAAAAVLGDVLPAGDAALLPPPDITPADSTPRVQATVPTAAEVEAALLAVQEVEFELSRLQEERWRLTRTESADVEAVAEARRALLLEALENRERPGLRAIRADREGLIAWIAGGGVLVAAGDPLARLVDPEVLRLNVRLAAVPEWLRPGARAGIRIGEQELDGSLTIVAPGSAAGELQVTVALDAPVTGMPAAGQALTATFSSGEP